MPVRKFRSIAEMDGDTWRETGDPELYRAIERLWRFGERVAPRRFPPGVHKHRDIDALNAQTEVWATHTVTARGRHDR